MNESTLSLRVDKLARIRVEIERLEEDAKRVSHLISLEIQPGEHAESEFFDAVRVAGEKKQTAWKAIAEKLNASRQLIAAHTKKQPFDYIRVTAKKSKVA